MLYYAADNISDVNVKRVSIFICVHFPYWKAESFQFLRICDSQSPTWLMLMPWRPMAPSHQQLPCWRFPYLRSSQWDLTVRPYVVYEYHDHNETTLVIDDALVPTRCQAINNYRVDPVCPVTVRQAWQLCTMCIFPVFYLVVADTLALKRLQAISNHQVYLCYQQKHLTSQDLVWVPCIKWHSDSVLFNYFAACHMLHYCILSCIVLQLCSMYLMDCFVCDCIVLYDLMLSFMRHLNACMDVLLVEAPSEILFHRSISKFTAPC